MRMMLIDIGSGMYAVKTGELAYVGDRVVIKCTTTDTPSWRKNGQLLINPESIGVNMILRNVQEGDSGVYCCNASLPQLELLVGGMKMSE